MIAIFVKSENHTGPARIYYSDIGSYLSRNEKLQKITNLGKLSACNWEEIKPDHDGEWINQKSPEFSAYIPLLSDSPSQSVALFSEYSLGVGTSRDPWAYNYSEGNLRKNISSMIDVYNAQTAIYRSVASENKGTDKPRPQDIVVNDPKVIGWSSGLYPQVVRGRRAQFDDSGVRISSYRPFTQMWLYYDDLLNDRPGQQDHVFPDANTENICFCITGVAERKGFSLLATNKLANLHFLDTGTLFPLKWYELKSAEEGLFATSEAGYVVRSGISDAGLRHFQTAYPAEEISKEDIFYYVYGLLHSIEYRERFESNLIKELPRIPCVKKAEDFWAFSRAGRALGELHVNYESVEPYPVTIKQGDLRLANIQNPETFYRVVKMKFGGNAREKDKSTVIYNTNITMQNIPLAAYDYVVNGKPALEWVMERQGVKTDKDSGIVNDANRYAIETVGDPAYPLKLFQRVITVSLRTMEIVSSLPALDIAGSPSNSDPQDADVELV